jgi:hypothetical protein
MMIFLLASGYLLTVYLLLALCKRTGRKNPSSSGSISLATQGQHQQDISATPDYLS